MQHHHPISALFAFFVARKAAEIGRKERKEHKATLS
jgi:hypothetical protein